MKKCSLAHFWKKLPSDLFLIWQICSAMSANDLINLYPQPVGEGGFKSRQDSVRRHVFLWAEKLKNYRSNLFEILT